MPRISVIIPVYNVEKYLKECLDSVIEQTFSDIEIICVNDGSTDNSLNILNSYSINDNRIKIISQENTGLAPARNAGMKIATGNYIFFLDSDDYFYNKNVLEILYNKAIETNSDLILSKAKAFYKGSNSHFENRIKNLNNNFFNFKPVEHKQILPINFIELIEDYPCTSWGVLYKRSFLKDNDIWFYNKRVIHEDNGFSLKVYSNFPTFTAITDYGVMYRIRNNSIMSRIEQKKFKKKKENVLISVNDAFDYIRKHKSFYTENLINEIRESSTYREYFCFNFEIKFLCRIIWQSNNKRINILSIPIYREKVRKNKLIYKVLGIPVYKKRLKYKYKNLEKMQLDFIASKLIKDLANNKIEKTSKIKPEIILSNNSDKNIRNSLESIGNFYFLPNKGNLGDVVIAFAEFQYFDSLKFNYKVFDISKKSSYKEDFNLVYGGGGIWHNLYHKDYQDILKVFKSPKLKKCIVLPSSFYNCDDVLKAFDERFIVFCREKQSYEYCIKKNKKAKFILADDMVVDSNFDIFNYSLEKSFCLTKSPFQIENIAQAYQCYTPVIEQAFENLHKYKSFEIGYLLRTDKESVFNNTKIKQLAIDPSSFAFNYACDKALNTLLTQVFLTIISQFDIVVTDRLHIGICAAKLGKKTLLIDNSYKKLSNVYEKSLKTFSNVHLVSVENMEDEIELVLKNIKPTNKLSLDEIRQVSRNFLITYINLQNNKKSTGGAQGK